MNKLLLFIIILAVAVAIFMGGMVVGVYYFPNLAKGGATININVPSKNNEKSILDSKVVSVIQLSGKVTAINGKELTIDSSGESMKFLVKDNANIIFNNREKEMYETKSFSDIKVGNDLSVGTKLVSEGKLEAFSILINQ